MIDYSQALEEAARMISILRPVCPTIAIAGSLRRGTKDRIDEIDLVGIPDLVPPPLPRAVFGNPMPKVFETKIDKLIDELHKEEKIFIKQNGPRSKKFLSLEAEVSFDLYLVRPPARWGVQYMIRTGPFDFSTWIVSQRHKRGALPNGYRVQGGAVFEGEEKVKDRELLYIPSIGFDAEESFFEFLEIDYIEPCKRAARWR